MYTYYVNGASTVIFCDKIIKRIIPEHNQHRTYLITLQDQVSNDNTAKLGLLNLQFALTIFLQSSLYQSNELYGGILGFAYLFCMKMFEPLILSKLVANV